MQRSYLADAQWHGARQVIALNLECHQLSQISHGGRNRTMKLVEIQQKGVQQLVWSKVGNGRTNGTGKIIL